MISVLDFFIFWVWFCLCVGVDGFVLFDAWDLVLGGSCVGVGVLRLVWLFVYTFCLFYVGLVVYWLLA